MFDLFGIRRRKKERAAKEAARIADEKRIYQQWLERDLAQRQAVVMKPVRQRPIVYRDPAPRREEPDYLTPMLIGGVIGASLASSSSHASEPERERYTPPDYSGDGGSYGGGGASSSWSDSSSSSSYDSGSSSSDSGGGSCGGSD